MHRSREWSGLPVIRSGSLAWMLTTLLVITVSLDPTAALAETPMQLRGALQTGRTVGVVAHRGAAAHAPENTLAAFELAISNEGTDFVETDVQLTADGVPVLMHDPDLDRTTNGTGPLASRTLAEIRELDAGSWFDERFRGERVPTFEEFVDLLGPAPVRAYVELKGPWPQERVAEVVELLRARSLSNRIVLASFERDTVQAVRELGPEFAVILQTRKLDASTVDFAVGLQLSGVCARDKLLRQHPAALQTLREAGIGAFAYTLNSRGQWQQGQDLGIDFFITDDPPALVAWRDDDSN